MVHIRALSHCGAARPRLRWGRWSPRATYTGRGAGLCLHGSFAAVSRCRASWWREDRARLPVWLLRASSPRARAALVHVWVALAYPVLLLRCDVTRAGSEGPAQLPRRTRPLLSCVELHHVAAGGHPRSPIGSWNITSWWTRRLLAAALGRLIHVRVSLRGDGRCCPPELSIWHEAVRSRTDYASAPAALARRAASHLRGRGVARERWRRL